MKKQTLTERFQELAGIKSLGEQSDWDKSMGQVNNDISKNFNDEEFELEDNEKDYLTDVTIEFHKNLNPELNIEKSKAIMDFIISQLEEMY
jgi:hypothetical protein